MYLGETAEAVTERDLYFQNLLGFEQNTETTSHKNTTHRTRGDRQRLRRRLRPDVRNKMPSDWTIFIVVIGTVAIWLFAKRVIIKRLHYRKHGKELPDPFLAEVIYQGVAIADITDREFTEMFWRTYRIEPRTAEARLIVENDDLWDQCMFDFRDPKSGNVCTTGFVGGTKPFTKDGKILLRGLYFGGTPNKKNSEQSASCNPLPAAVLSEIIVI